MEQNKVFPFTNSKSITVQHALGKVPVCEVVIDNGGIFEVILPKSIIALGTDEILVTFQNTHSGFIRVL